MGVGNPRQCSPRLRHWTRLLDVCFFGALQKFHSRSTAANFPLSEAISETHYSGGVQRPLRLCDSQGRRVMAACSAFQSLKAVLGFGQRSHFGCAFCAWAMNCRHCSTSTTTGGFLETVFTFSNSCFKTSTATLNNPQSTAVRCLSLKHCLGLEFGPPSVGLASSSWATSDWEDTLSAHLTLATPCVA